MAGKQLVKQSSRPSTPSRGATALSTLRCHSRWIGSWERCPGRPRACVLRRQRDVFGDARFARLGSLSVALVYNLRHSAGYKNQRVVLTTTRPT